jgi:hypothetical protein
MRSISPEADRCWPMLASPASGQDLRAVRVHYAELCHCPAGTLDPKFPRWQLATLDHTGLGARRGVRLLCVSWRCGARPRWTLGAPTGCGLRLVLNDGHVLLRELFVREIAANTDAVTDGSFAGEGRPSGPSAGLPDPNTVHCRGLESGA